MASPASTPASTPSHSPGIGHQVQGLGSPGQGQFGGKSLYLLHNHLWVVVVWCGHGNSLIISIIFCISWFTEMLVHAKI